MLDTGCCHFVLIGLVILYGFIGNIDFIPYFKAGISRQCLWNIMTVFSVLGSRCLALTGCGRLRGKWQSLPRQPP